MTLNLEADDMTLHLWPALEHFCLACDNLPLLLLENIHQLRAGKPSTVISLWSVGASTCSCPCDAVCAPGVTTLLKLLYAMTPCPLSTCVFMCHDVTWQEPHDHTAGRLILLICLPHKGPQRRGDGTRRAPCVTRESNVGAPDTRKHGICSSRNTQVVCGIRNALPCFWAAFAGSSTA